ncbi:NADH:flavin oxidoreductase/NADH oxidase family protein [Streptomyces sp. Tu102]|uniref:NADH:flavin oxidoreductase/NADH oxidase family protein n=1 Tax=Streptomyces TaxID=1883 RepID=UPI001BDD2442|nr:NADH:flavin oxidoreductase/NADH oxidase family protein [Streptomyces sp. Tu102]MBT1098054.1 NADH:flavin oxidoreductase/NADH oxidase family protein [Streptomyces sp. Tu102]
MSIDLFAPLTLASGQVLKNRIAKAAMEEGMAGRNQAPDRRLIELYRQWGKGGAGLLITGNVMVHAEALASPGDVVLDENSALTQFRRWAAAAKGDGSALVMQISHPGRQIEKAMPGVVWGPSEVAMDLGKRHNGRFRKPTAMTLEQIQETVQRFATAAAKAEAADFDGVEIHAAHGYLISQFLSPLANKRTDDWGGSLENRARLLLDVVTRIRAEVRPGFIVGVKLNSADFQRGGFEPDDARRVINMLEPLGVDFVELSGGSYESPAMTGRPVDGRTAAREAYFLEIAADMARTSRIPLMLTGGISRMETANAVLASGVQIVGIGTALAVTPDLPQRWQVGEEAERALRRVTWSDKTLASAASVALVRHQLRRMSRGAAPVVRVHPACALLHDQVVTAHSLRRYRRWLKSAS